MLDGISVGDNSCLTPLPLRAGQVLWQSSRGCYATIERDGDGFFSSPYQVECLCEQRQFFRGREDSAAAASAAAFRLGTSIRCRGVQAA